MDPIEGMTLKEAVGAADGLIERLKAATVAYDSLMALLAERDGQDRGLAPVLVSAASGASVSINLDRAVLVAAIADDAAQHAHDIIRGWTNLHVLAGRAAQYCERAAAAADVAEGPENDAS